MDSNEQEGMAHLTLGGGEMLGKAIVRGLLAVALLISSAQAVTIDTVPVGNLGNAGEQSRLADYGDSTYYGGVDYAYNIGKYEVTAGQYAEFLNAVAATDTYGLYNAEMDSSPRGCQITRHGISGSYTYDFSGGTIEVPGSTASDWENRPVGDVGWGDAARFTNWLHNGQGNGDTEDGAYNLSGTHPYYNPDGSISDLTALRAALTAVNREVDWRWSIPSEDEWYKAAYHKNDGVTGNYWEYPTGSDSTPSNDLINPDPGNNANFLIAPADYTIGGPYYRTEVGEFELSESPYGTFDQGGNLWEWDDADISGSPGGLRGGDVFNGDVITLHASYRPDAINPAIESYVFGFRVARVPEPGSLAMMIAAAFSLLAYAWRRRKWGHQLLYVIGVLAILTAEVAQADVFNMGPGLTSLETVPVGNRGNAGEWSGESYVGYGPDRICGGVDYTYNIGKYEVTAGQYAEFLNAVAKTDTYGLYNASMDSGFIRLPDQTERFQR